MWDLVCALGEFAVALAENCWVRFRVNWDAYLLAFGLEFLLTLGGALLYGLLLAALSG